MGCGKLFLAEEILIGELTLPDALANDTILMILAGLALFIFVVLLFLTWLDWRLRQAEGQGRC